jgi:serine protease Do
MIRKTLRATQAATFSVDLPNKNLQGMPTPTGTGFFVSPDGWFVTAAHVITENNRPDGPVRTDIHQAWLMKEMRPGQFLSGMCQAVQFDYIDPKTDFALLKVDFARNANKEHLKGLTGFPYLEISGRELDEGEPVYAFGYPLSDVDVFQQNSGMTVGHAAHSPRLTSAIVASTMDRSKMVSTSQDVKVYVLDKALNYGNSGGPIVATDTGKVHALCSRFQSVQIPQPHLMFQGKPIIINIPSLYGVVSSLGNAEILKQLQSRNVPISGI